MTECRIDRLSAELDALAGDVRIGAVVIAAAGSAFSSGHDLKEMTPRRADPDRGRAYFAGLMDRCSATMQKIVRLSTKLRYPQKQL